METTLQDAIAAQQAGDTQIATTLYEQVLLQAPDQIDALTLLGPLRYEAGDIAGAIVLLNRAITIDPSHPLAWYNLGLALIGRDDTAAQSALMQATRLAPDRQQFWAALGKQLLKIGNPKAAQTVFFDLNKQTRKAEYLIHEAESAAALKDYATARNLAKQAAELAHATGDDHHRRRAMVDLNRYDHLLGGAQQQLDGAYLHLALASLQDALPLVQMARIYLAHSQYLLAMAVLETAVKVDPKSIEIRWLLAFAHALPIYSSQAQIAEIMASYEDRQLALLTHIDTMTDADLDGAEYLPELLQPLFIAYNGEDICRVQSLTGDVVHKLLTRRYGVPALLPDAEREARRAEDGRIRLAIVSETFYYHSNMKLRRGWLRRIDRTKFKLCLYHVGKETDLYTQEIAAMADEFYHIPHDFEATLAKLQSDAPDIIQYTNIGLSTLTIKLAAMRLAPVQCNTWGHPITSGSPVMDYFISNEMMETPEAQDYYRETLVNFPGLSIVPEKIFIDRHFTDLKPLTRADYGISANSVFYLCLQSVNKYLPRHDDIYARIAMGVPDAQFIFIEHAANPAITDLFKLRVRGPFHAMGLDPDKHLVFLPFQDQKGYSNLHRLADITLDSLEWSGANTTFEALELGGLLLTCPGRFMRGRHTYGILTYIGMPELIAATEPDYIDMAIRWGKDAPLRLELRAKLAAAKPNLYRDPGIAEALNAFYERAYLDAVKA